MVHIDSRSFRFSVANNSVGHFICRLKDRIWPDFVCHFHLFNGRFAKAPIFESCWHADTELSDISDHRPIALKSTLGFLRSGSKLAPSSEAALSKFGLVPIDHMDFSNKNAVEASSSSAMIKKNFIQPRDCQIHFGSFSPATKDIHTLKPCPISSAGIDRKKLMEHFLSQAESEERQLTDFIHLGGFKCPLNVPYPHYHKVF